MKKILLGGLLICLSLSLAGCEKADNSDDFEIKTKTIKELVKGWQLYTNPAFRYELRFPKGWLVWDSGEDGLISRFQPENNSEDSVKIMGHTNWKEKYTLEEFYENRVENLFTAGYESEEIEIDNEKAIWFKQVRDRMEARPEKLVDVIAVNLNDRIIEIEIRNDFDDAKVIINSLNFYGSKAILID